MSSKLDRFISNLDESQRLFFFFQFPALLFFWIDQNIAGKILEKFAPQIELSSVKVQAIALNKMNYTNLIVAWYHLRQIYPPKSSRGKRIYRLTGIPNLPENPKVRFSNNSQLKSTTSWTLDPLPVVAGRAKRQENKFDIILSYKLQGTKHVLFDYESAYQLCSDMIENSERYEQEYKTPKKDHWRWGLWQTLMEYQKEHEQEKEVVIFLANNEEIICDWIQDKRSGRAQQKFTK